MKPHFLASLRFTYLLKAKGYRLLKSSTSILNTLSAPDLAVLAFNTT
jgi:hypothetical protein